MLTYPKIRHVLSCIYTTDVGLSEDAQREMLKRSLVNHDWAEQFRSELVSAFSDVQTSWRDLLFNDKYEVFEADSEEIARQVAVDLLWNPVFPGTPTPVSK
ncbi:MAG TPA: hypothetical protein VKE98_22895 [Gemmataceae bacterium]|nr:hypothetical protein [Gemmataceae bacterium]